MEGIRATREEIGRFLSIQKYDYGSGRGSDYGDGCGSGSDYGYGCGYGKEYCNGGKGCLNSGNGCGSGAGNGPSDRYSNGDGYGYGSGYGNGDGSGNGYDYFFRYDKDCGDIKALNGDIVDYIDDKPTIITQVHGNFAKGYIVKNDLSLDSCFIAKAGNLFAHGKTLKDAVTKAGTKIEKMPIKEQIENFIVAFGSLDTEHTGKEFYNWHHILTGSCRMGRDEFCKSHKINLKQKYSVKYFLDITKRSYGSEIIKLIEEAYKVKQV